VSALQPTLSNAYVVVSFWHEKSGDGSGGDYEYEHRPTLNYALDTYREYQDGEYARATAIGIFEAKNGLPIGEALSPARLLQLMHETRKAA
jgi:hypothetical protein